MVSSKADLKVRLYDHSLYDRNLYNRRGRPSGRPNSLHDRRGRPSGRL